MKISGRDYAEEESIPLNSHRPPSPNGHRFDDDYSDEYRRRAKGKERAEPTAEGEPIFNVGSDEEDERKL